MPKILCTLPNASLFINGHDFEPVEGGVQSVEELEDEHLEHFSAIQGYQIVDGETERKPVPQSGKQVTVKRVAKPTSAK